MAYLYLFIGFCALAHSEMYYQSMSHYLGLDAQLLNRYLSQWDLVAIEEDSRGSGSCHANRMSNSFQWRVLCKCNSQKTFPFFNTESHNTYMPLLSAIIQKVDYFLIVVQ